MLTFVGLGLYDERSITIRGRDAIRMADHVFIERYTSWLAGATVEDLENYYDRPITTVDRTTVEQSPEEILTLAEDADVVFVTGGDPMISTTHLDLRLRAAALGIKTSIINAPSAATAASALTGLQNYRFGKATTLPFPDERWEGGVPPSVIATIQDNHERGLHTITYLDLEDGARSALTADVAASYLAPLLDVPIGVVVARAGSDEPLVVADRLSRLAEQDFGPPLHLLVIPGSLHDLERDALRTFAGAPEDALPIE